MKKIIIVGLIATNLLFAGCAKNTTAPSTANVDAFAKCITAAGMKMYGTETCPHCQAQKALFGDSFQYIDFTDCLKIPNACSGIDRVPTWQFKDGTQEVGEKTFAELAKKTQCKLPK